MSFGGFLGSMAGDLPKAVLFVRKYQKDLLYTQEQLDAYAQSVEDLNYEMISLFDEQGRDCNVATEIEDFKADALSSAMKLADSQLENAASALEGASVLSGGNESFAQYKSIANANGYVAMEVQYNPSTIRLDTSAGTREVNDNTTDNIANTQIRQFTSPAVTNLTVTLVFDAMNQMDAFMLDASMMSTGGALAMGKSIVENLDGESEGFSVRTQVEGLIATLFSPLTRRVIFAWGGMIFKGEMFQVNANYTMFNKAGNPIRATVQVVIQQNEETEAKELSSQWNKSFNAVFGEAGADNLSGVASKWDQAKNNALLNFSI